MVKYLPKAILLSLLIGMPAIAETDKWGWDMVRDAMLGPMRSDLMARCAWGRSVNLKGLSAYDSVFVEIDKDDALRQGVSNDKFRATQSGLAAAMAVACPTVW